MTTGQILTLTLAAPVIYLMLFVLLRLEDKLPGASGESTGDTQEPAGRPVRRGSPGSRPPRRG